MIEPTQTDKDKAETVLHQIDERHGIGWRSDMLCHSIVQIAAQAIADARKEERHRTLRALSAFNEEWRQELTEALETGEKEGERG